MIRVGLAGWGDHPALYAGLSAKSSKLQRYAEHFDIVEVDSSFYAIQPEKNYSRWAEETPAGFGFIVKAFQGMTGHQQGADVSGDRAAMFDAFRRSIGPLREAGKLKAVLMQYPPWFDCSRANVQVLRDARLQLDGLPAALEFRHQSWFAGSMRERTLEFMRREGWIHSVCDEPQSGDGSIPAVVAPTDGTLTIVRFHGRNTDGWSQRTSGPNWREVRYLYRYSVEELLEWKTNLERLDHEGSAEVCVIFNNNSGGDAAGNAKNMMALLGQNPPSFPDWPPQPEQLDLFE